MTILLGWLAIEQVMKCDPDVDIYRIHGCKVSPTLMPGPC